MQRLPIASFDGSEISGRRVVWRDKAGVLHAGEGADVHPGVRLLWTQCGKHDIPANSAWLQRPKDNVTCPDCLAAIAAQEHAP